MNIIDFTEQQKSKVIDWSLNNKRSSLCSHYDMRLFIWFSNTMVRQYWNIASEASFVYVSFTYESMTFDLTFIFLLLINRWLLTFFVLWSQCWASQKTFLLNKYQRFLSLLNVVFTAQKRSKVIDWSAKNHFNPNYEMRLFKVIFKQCGTPSSTREN